MNAFSFVADPGLVPPTITVQRFGVAQLRISWSSSSCAGGQDYGIYMGTIGVWYSHAQIDCDDGAPPPLQEDVPLPAGNAYFIVVPHSDLNNVNPLNSDEGSYGTDNVAGVMTQRPQAPAVGRCVQNQVLACSP